jgi:prepilin-type N-terminal cleavage/methylation domain-containing protein
MSSINKGYTLVELLVTMSLLVIVLTGGTAIFYRSFKSSGLSDAKTSLNASMKTLDELIERSLRYGTVLKVINLSGEKDRSDCVLGNETGVTGSTVIVRDPSGGIVTYSLGDGKVSSNSGIISNEKIAVSRLEFTWICRSGVNDKIKLLIEAAPIENTASEWTSIYEKDINLLNSGIN